MAPRSFTGMHETAAPAFFVWRSLAVSPCRAVGALVFALIASVFFGMTAIPLGHACIRKDEFYASEPKNLFTMRDALYMGDVGGLAASPLLVLWFCCLVNTYEWFLAQNAAARSEWLRHVFTGVRRSDSLKKHDEEARSQAAEEAFFWDQAGWLVVVPLALFHVFWSFIQGALVGALGAAMVHIGQPKHVALCGMVGAGLVSLMLLLVVSIAACVLRSKQVPLPLSDEYEAKAEEDTHLKDKLFLHPSIHPLKLARDAAVKGEIAQTYEASKMPKSPSRKTKVVASSPVFEPLPAYEPSSVFPSSGIDKKERFSIV